MVPREAYFLPLTCHLVYNFLNLYTTDITKLNINNRLMKDILFS